MPGFSRFKGLLLYLLVVIGHGLGDDLLGGQSAHEHALDVLLEGVHEGGAALEGGNSVHGIGVVGVHALERLGLSVGGVGGQGRHAVYLGVEVVHALSAGDVLYKLRGELRVLAVLADGEGVDGEVGGSAGRALEGEDAIPVDAGLSEAARWCRCRR